MASFAPNKQHVLVSGGAGFIGCHTVVSLVEAGYHVIVVDNLVNSNSEALNRVRRITGCPEEQIVFHNVDMCDKAALEAVFQSSPAFSACIHFAALKSVGESVIKPLLYYNNNLGSTLNLLELMDKYSCPAIVFSSSATVYGAAAVPIKESALTGVGVTNAYGRTKYMIEEMLKDYKRSKDLAGPPCTVSILRYFNPIGAHPSGLIGEDPNGVPNNLMPFVAQVAVGRRPKLMIFGNDHATADGTGVRDFIHVMDAAEGHIAALRYMAGKGHGQCGIFNLGTGKGCSVLDMVHAMERASGKPVAYEFGPRREGDVAECYADISLAKEELGWTATRDLDEMCRGEHHPIASPPIC